MSQSRILYCHCAYAKIIPEQVKNEVLQRLASSGVAFEAVADLCELSARSDPSLKRLIAGADDVRIAACFPRSVKWLFNAAGAPLPENSPELSIAICNMRKASAEETVTALLSDEPNSGADSQESPSTSSEDPPAPPTKSSV